MDFVSEKRFPHDLKAYAKDFRMQTEPLIRSGHVDLASACSLFLAGIPPSIRPQVEGKIQFDLDDPPSNALEKLEGLVQSIMLAAIPATADGVEEPALDKLRKPGWSRERKAGPLDFPKEGVGIHADINFGTELALHNTRLLYCYSLCNDRVTPMVLFVKSWAKRRKINNPYSGTLSSYGYVLMVLHFLINVVQPPALHNLQHFLPEHHTVRLINNKWPVSFFDKTAQLLQLKSQSNWIINPDPLGVLLRNFFHYYARYGPEVIAGGFDWATYVISVRTPGGLLLKKDKGWVRAETTLSDELVEVRQRYVLSIEDPFEIEHNVARTVTGPGAAAIKNEFRRAWRIIATIGNENLPVDGELLDEFVEERGVGNNVVGGVA
jgi:terminal uridylyltransferase